MGRSAQSAPLMVSIWCTLLNICTYPQHTEVSHPSTFPDFIISVMKRKHTIREVYY